MLENRASVRVVSNTSFETGSDMHFGVNASDIEAMLKSVTQQGIVLVDELQSAGVGPFGRGSVLKVLDECVDGFLAEIRARVERRDSSQMGNPAHPTGSFPESVEGQLSSRNSMVAEHQRRKSLAYSGPVGEQIALDRMSANALESAYLMGSDGKSSSPTTHAKMAAALGLARLSPLACPVGGVSSTKVSSAGLSNLSHSTPKLQNMQNASSAAILGGSIEVLRMDGE